jgi:flagellar basal-body rod protein FlgG
VERDAGGPFVTRKGPVKVTEDGAVFSDGELVAQLDIVGLPDKGLSKVGYTYFSSTAAGQPSDAKVIQGYLEESNVSVVKEMVSMIEAFRAYEFNVKLLQTQDELLGRAVSEVGRSLR